MHRAFGGVGAVAESRVIVEAGSHAVGQPIVLVSNAMNASEIRI